MGEKDHTPREDNHEETKGTHLKSDHLISLYISQQQPRS